jgi:hypothetical protein
MNFRGQVEKGNRVLAWGKLWQKDIIGVDGLGHEGSYDFIALGLEGERQWARKV